jgi:signal transduction histidine kinase
MKRAKGLRKRKVEPERTSREGPPPGGFDHRRYHVQRLYDISQLLARFASALESLPSVLALASEGLHIQVAVLVKERLGRLRTIVWTAPEVSAMAIEQAKLSARAAFAFYATSTPSIGWVRGSERGEEEAVRLESIDKASPGSPVHWLTFPLTANHRVFGVLRVQCKQVLDETDRAFLSTVAQLIADALDRAAARNRELAALADVREALQARDAFISIASHELKGPLAALTLQVGTVRDLVERGAAKKQIMPKLETAVRQIGRVNRLIGNILGASRVTTGRIELEREDLDLATVLAHVVAREKEAWATEQCVLTLKTAGPVFGRWDRLRIDQIITNLLSNALKYGLGNPVEVELVADANKARLSVRDHGIGIAPGEQSKIFEPFQRAVDRRSFTGLGLGLWIVRRIVEAMGGTIRVESSLGAGATFTVELPRRQRTRRAA